MARGADGGSPEAGQALFGGASGMAGAGVALLALAGFLRSPLAVAAVVVTSLVARAVAATGLGALGLASPPALFAYGTAAMGATVLVHRFRERLVSGDQPDDAVRTALERTGWVIATTCAAWAVSCAALPLADGGTRGLGPALAVTAAAAALVPLTLLPALLSVLGHGPAWPSRRRRVGDPPPATARLGRAVAARPRRWTLLAAALVAALSAIGALLVPDPPPSVVVAVAGVLTALVLALVLRSLISPVYVTAGALLVAWGAGTVAVAPGWQLSVFFLTLVTNVCAALLVLSRVQETARSGRGPHACAALAVKYAGPPALAVLLLTGALTAGAYDLLSGVILAVGGTALSLVIVPGLAALLGSRAWWPDTAPSPPPTPVKIPTPH
ncbi:MMPL family transporter [Sphaerisporangium aureirubrum]|uniref:MMPL family transporter n=1 Tax=Sphaerisporangium aureirubrum TaxID=1544736 RepID=A0ABW1NHA7_9ACTN